MFRGACLLLGSQVFGNQTFHDDDVQPAAVELSVLFVHADLAESAGATQGATRRVEWKDARHQLPVAAVARDIDKSREQLTTKSTAAGITIEVDREFCDSPVARPRSV